NDVANSFGTAVGSGVVTLKQACILASIFETMGSVLLGTKVSEAIWKGLIDVEMYHPNQTMLMAGSVSAMFVASFLKLPISGTHCIVGTTIGFSLVAEGQEGVRWSELIRIVMFWFVSPLLSGIMSGILFFLVHAFILHKADPVPNGLCAWPVFYACTIGINLFSSCILEHHCWALTNFLCGFSVPFSSSSLYNSLKEDHEETKLSLGVSENRNPVSEVGSATGLLQDVVEERTVSFKRGDLEKWLPSVDLKEETSIDMQLPNGSLVQFNQTVSNQINSSGHYQYHTVHKDSGLYKELLHKLHLAKVGDCMGESGDKPLRRNNSYTSYTMAICGMPQDSFRTEEGEQKGEAMEKLAWPNIYTKKHIRIDSYISYCNAVSDLHSASEMDMTIKAEMGLRDRKGSRGSLEEWYDQDKPKVSLFFQFLQILTACFGSFAHGGNDVSNAVGPLVALYLVYKTGDVSSKMATPIWLLLYVVIQTMGKDLTPITPSSGFSIELASALTVVIASNIGLPISTTHCKVGSVVSVGWLQSKKAVDCATIMAIFKYVILKEKPGLK
uniref:Phosphate transporter n=1 Tax=Jaculus jaculus TaxID=51337 RepID=A0A8C5JWM9_JACJA